jgi:carboxymethylenebutenolidase
VLVEEVPFADVPTPSGPMRTYILRPKAAGRFPGLILFSEIFQVTASTRRIATTLAGHGYVLAIPEIFHELEPPGMVLGYDEAASRRGNAHKTAKPLAGFDADIRAALGHLRGLEACNGRLGVIGSCVGGHLAVRAAMEPGVQAAACLYATDLHGRSLGQGGPDNTLDRLNEVEAELLMIWGRHDPHIPEEGRMTIYRSFSAAGLNFTWHEFNAAHAFLRDEGYRYNPSLADAVYGLIFELFDRRLAFGAG